MTLTELDKLVKLALEHLPGESTVGTDSDGDIIIKNRECIMLGYIDTTYGEVIDYQLGTSKSKHYHL